MKHIATGSIAAALWLALAACGGGGGSSTGGGPKVPGGKGVSDIYRADPDKSQAAAEAASTAEQKFSSVTQSSNVDSGGVTTDSASATYADGRLTVTVAQDGGGFTFNTADDRIDSETTASAASGLRITSSTFVKQTGAGSSAKTTLAYTAHASTGSGATDWLAGGYWLRLTGDIGAGSVTDVEAGAFVDGPELRGSPTLPTSGGATYNGEARGLYAAEYGTDFTGVSRGSHELGEYEGDLTLTAAFGSGDTGAVSGRIENIGVAGVFVDGSSGQVTEFEESTDYRITLGSATITRSNGQFESDRVTLMHPGFTITSSGSWGGKFSSEDDADGNPRLMAGTHGGKAVFAGGTEAAFVGAFYGVTGR